MAVVAMVQMGFDSGGKPWLRALGLIAVLAGLAYAAAWLTLLGGVFRTNDAPRIAAIAVADLTFALWCLVLASAMRRHRMVGIASVGIVLAVRGAIELRYLAGVLDPPPPRNPGTNSGLEGIFLGALVIGGWVILAFWEIVIARWLIRLREQSSGRGHAPHA